MPAQRTPADAAAAAMRPRSPLAPLLLPLLLLLAAHLAHANFIDSRRDDSIGVIIIAQKGDVTDPITSKHYKVPSGQCTVVVDSFNLPCNPGVFRRGLAVQVVTEPLAMDLRATIADSLDLVVVQRDPGPDGTCRAPRDTGFTILAGCGML